MRWVFFDILLLFQMVHSQKRFLLARARTRNLRNKHEEGGGRRSLLLQNMPWNRQETRDFASYWQGRGVSRINFSPCHNRGGHFLGLEQALGPPSPSGMAERCWSFHNALYVTWEGQLLACCNDLKGETNRGDLRRLALRETHDLERRREPSYPICEGCDFPFR